MLVVWFEELLQESEKTLQQICEHVELEFLEDMLPAAQHKILFGSRFRSARCGALARELGYEDPFTS